MKGPWEPCSGVCPGFSLLVSLNILTQTWVALNVLDPFQRAVVALQNKGGSICWCMDNCLQFEQSQSVAFGASSVCCVWGKNISYCLDSFSHNHTLCPGSSKRCPNHTKKGVTVLPVLILCCHILPAPQVLLCVLAKLKATKEYLLTLWLPEELGLTQEHSLLIINELYT